MAIAETNREQLRISEETSFAETPSSPTMDIFKYTGEDMLGTKQTVNTATIRSDANRDGVKKVAEGGEGNINFELIYDMYTKHFEGAFRNTFTTISTTAATISAAAGTQRFEDSGSGFTSGNGYVVGAWIKVSGFYNSENNGFFRITEVDASGDYITVANGASSIVTESAGESVTIAGKYIRNSTTNKSYLIEKAFLDVGTFAYFPGVVFGGFNLSVTALEILTGSFSTMAQQGVPSLSTVSGSTNSANTNQQMTASANVSNIMINNSLVSGLCIQALNVTVDNGLRPRYCVGNEYSQNFGRGEFAVDGTLDYFYEDNTLEDYKKNHTSLNLSWRATDVDGNVMIFTIPSLYLNEGGPAAGAKDDDIIPSMSWAANKSTAGDATFTMQLDMLAA